MRSDDDYVLRIDSNVEISDSAGGTQVSIRGNFSIICLLILTCAATTHSIPICPVNLQATMQIGG